MPYRYTIEDLAGVTGLPLRTLRHYRAKDVLPAPHMRGRTGYYSDSDLARLRLAIALGDQGFPLDLIARLMRSTGSQARTRALLHVLDASRDAKTTYATIQKEFVDACEVEAPGVVDNLLDYAMIRRLPDDQIQADAVALALIDDLVNHGMTPTAAAVFARDVGQVAQQVADMIEDQVHPQIPERAFEQALVDAAGAMFREALMGRLRR